jgi:endogenous inhibitor of DNA gyrase (YacG/DUF329 family)
MENEFIDNNHTIDDPQVKVYCWNCGKKFYIKKQNYYTGELFCSDECRIESLKGENEKLRISNIHRWNYYKGEKLK